MNEEKAYELINKWRIIPRIMALVVTYMGAHCSHWYFTMSEPTQAQTAFAGTILALVVGFYKFYMETGSPKK